MRVGDHCRALGHDVSAGVQWFGLGAMLTTRPGSALSLQRLSEIVRPQTEMAAVIIQVKVKPNARTSELVQAADGTWLAKLKSAPVDGKANEELVALVAQQFKCRRACVSIKTGASGRMKLVKVEPFREAARDADRSTTHD